MKIRAIFVAMLLALGPLPGVAQDFDAGWSAYQSGDYAAALQDFIPLAKQGDIDAQYNLGGMYFRGEGVAQDYAEAARWYRLAAEQGDASAQYNLGVIFEFGYGVTQDYTESVRWYRLAALLGHARAQYNLSLDYASGRGVGQDPVLAHMWVNISAANQDVRARDWRQNLEKTMSATDVTEAQRLARICMESNYQDCG